MRDGFPQVSGYYPSELAVVDATETADNTDGEKTEYSEDTIPF